MPKTDDIRARTGVYRTDDGRYRVSFLNGEGQLETIDLTAEIERIASEAVKEHQLNYHGG